MKVVVITGSTRGIGYGLAEAFLQMGCAVALNGRSPSRVDHAIQALSTRFDPQRLCGIAADVTDPAQVQALWDGAVARFGRVDIWINNAGLENSPGLTWQVSPADLRAVVETNLIGAMLCCQVAIRGMAAQGGGQIYNMEGMGSEGRLPPGLTPYGATKYALAYLTKALVAETADLPIQIGSISPGMVLTDMLMATIPPEREAQARRFFNIMADRVETVAPWLAARMLANRKSGVRIAWLTTPKMVGRMLLTPFRKRDLFANPTPDR